MNTERPEEDSRGFADAILVALVFLVVLALMAGGFLVFSMRTTSIEVHFADEVEATAPMASQSAAPMSKTEAETPFADDNSPALANPTTPEPPRDVKPMN